MARAGTSLSDPSRFRGHRLLVAVNEARLAAIGQPEDGQLAAALAQAEAALDAFDRGQRYARQRASLARIPQHGERAGTNGWGSSGRASNDDAIDRNLRKFVELVEAVDGWMVGEDDPPFEWSRDGTLAIARLGVERGMLYVIRDTADIYATTDQGRAWLGLPSLERRKA